LILRARLAENFQAIHLWQHQIEEDSVGLVLHDREKSVAAFSCERDFKAGLGETTLVHFRNDRVVFDNQDSFGTRQITRR
jgi:hypothetical protein